VRGTVRRPVRRLVRPVVGFGGGGGIEPVDLSLASGSLRFPENNNETSISGFRGFLEQPTSNMPNALASDGAFFTIIRIPADRTHDNRKYRIAGNANFTGGIIFNLCYYGTDYFNASLRGKLCGTVKGNSGTTVDVNSLIVDETDLLMVFKRSTDDFSVDWYSLADGTKHTGPTTTEASSVGMNTWRSNPVLIGGGDLNSTSTDIARPDGYFTGEMQSIGYAEGAVSDANWQSIALGADIVTTLGASNVTWLREYDGTTATYSPPAAATSDLTSDNVAVDGANLEPGSFFRRQDATNYLTIDYKPSGKVYALTASGSSMLVPFSGLAGGTFTGDVQVRLIYEDGTVHKDWTTAATIGAGTWSGSITVNKTSSGWVVAQARISTNTEPDCQLRERFGVGYKIGVMGQSQLEIWTSQRDRDDQVDSSNTMKASASMEFQFEQVSKKQKVFRVGPHPSSDGAVAFIDQWYSQNDDTPIELVGFAEAGTGAISLITDADTSREWSDLDEIVTYVGSDFTAMLWQWGTNDTGFGSNYGELLDAVIKGTGASAADHYLEDGTFDSGIEYILSPFTRANTTSAGPFDTDQTAIYSPVRDAQIAYFDTETWTVGPMVDDMQIASGGGPHQDESVVKGNPLVGTRLSMTLSRLIGTDTSTNPSVASAQFTDGTQDVIEVTITLPNGNALKTDGGDSAVTGFEVSEDSGSTFSRSGFTAARVGNVVQITKTSGTWPSGDTEIYYHFGGPMSYGTAGPSEATLLAGVLYETYSDDLQGLGLPVRGSDSSFAVADA